MSNRSDLTRWNRAGLRRFRYIDGNAATYLETLRQALHERFPKWKEIEGEPVSEEAIQAASGRERESLLRKRREQLLQLYQKESRDIGWLITRSLARACHILTEHMDAYANEGFIGTATQWDHVRRMVEMLDYHPAPPASATTWLALIAKAAKAGTVAEGFQVKYAPEDGGSPVKFETLSDLDIDSDLNLLYAKDWKKSQQPISDAVVWTKKNGDSIKALDISGGNVGVLLHAEAEVGKPVLLAEVDHAAGKIDFAPPGFTGAESWLEHQVKLLTGAKDVRPIGSYGERVIEFDQVPSLSAGDVILWSSLGGKFNEVGEVSGMRATLVYPGAFPGVGDTVYRLHKIEPSAAHDDAIVFPLSSSYTKVIVRENGVLRQLTSSDCCTDDGDDKQPLWRRVKSGKNISEIYIHYAGDAPLAQQIKVVNPSDFVIAGAPKGFRSGDWVVGASAGNYFALQIESIEEREEDFVICFISFAANVSAASIVISESLGSALRNIQVAMDETELFDKTLSFFIEGEADNLPVTAIQGVGDAYAGKLTGISTIRDLLEMSATSVAGISDIRLREFKTKAEMILTFEITEEALALSDQLVYALLESMSASGLVTMTGEAEFGVIERIYGPLQYELRPKGFDRNSEWVSEGYELELEARPEALVKERTLLLECNGETLVADVEALVGDSAVRLSERVKADTFVKADTNIYANVVQASHGERKPEKILGSGDATQSNQSFIFAVKDVSFVPDATMASGVRADIDLAVDGQEWEQVSAFNDSTSTDIHYTVRMTEEGYLKINFGDGSNARRLPTGKNNLRISFRQGTGSDGNLDPGSLVKPVKPHAYVKSVVQPMASSGGNAMQDAASLCEDAPSTVLTLERAVSVADFARLAASHSSVWQANAFVRLEVSGREEVVEVVVVPADGGELGELKAILEEYLLSHALPGVQVSVTLFDSLRPQVDVTIQVDSDQYDPEELAAIVGTELLSRFSLKQRKLGQNLYLSEIYAVVEGITGVERSICNLKEWDEAEEAWIEQRVVKAGSQRRLVYVRSGDVLMLPFKEYEA